ncbi:MAG: hypothetical protein A2Y14_03935 [Verrucomicrobia bacterium GWF2_51_19]|nr:MAG: hypothetical protein A2Y14_03935 [Verrucomicrobia bacterium GWF2_51_19]HCJ11690.1 hypothetical protein [Opitutae bacterium]
MKLSKITLSLLALSVMLFQSGCRTTQNIASSPANLSQNSTVALLEGEAEPMQFTDINEGVRAEPSHSYTSTLSPLASTESQTHTVQKGDSLWSIAKKNNVSLDQLLAANNLNKGSTLSVGQTLSIPSKTTYAASNSSSTTTGEGYSYSVQKGDTLSSIAKAAGLSVAAIRSANNLNSSNIFVDQSLFIPGNADTLKAKLAKMPHRSTQKATPVALQNGEYVIQSGDTLSLIAKRTGTTVSQLVEWNSISNPARLRVGQHLKVNASSTSSASNLTASNSSSSNSLSSANTNSGTTSSVSSSSINNTPSSSAPAFDDANNTTTASAEAAAGLDDAAIEEIFNNADEIPVVSVNK